MIIVAVAALAIGIDISIMWQRSNDFRNRSQDHAILEQRCRVMAESNLSLAASTRANFEFIRRSNREEREALHASFRQVLKKYANDPNLGKADARMIADHEAKLNQSATDEEANYDRKSIAIERQAEAWVTPAKEIMIWAEFHAALKRKYDRAARHPWEAVSLDPPEPGWGKWAESPGENAEEGKREH